jgi:hypothetical protein
MHKRAVAAFVALGALGAAGCDKSAMRSAAVDSFCAQWAAAFCHKIWQCPTAHGPSPLGGSSEAACTDGWARSCSDLAGQTGAVSCAGATQIDPAARDLCLNQINDPSCDDFNAAAYSNDCDQVCVTASGAGGMTGDGAGGTTGGGAGGMEGGGGSGGPVPNSDPVAFCQNSNRVACSRAFECTPADQRDSLFTFVFGNSVEECQGLLAAVCGGETCTNFTSDTADACLSAQQATSCDDVLAGMVPPVCFDLGCN